MVALREARGADLSAQGYEMYAKTLSRYDIRDVRAAITRIAEAPRGEYESKIPELGEVKLMVEQEERKRTHIPFEPCGNCWNGIVVKHTGRGPSYRSWAEDCDCKKDWQMKKRAAQGITEDRKTRAAGE